MNIPLMHWGQKKTNNNTEKILGISGIGIKVKQKKNIMCKLMTDPYGE